MIWRDSEEGTAGELEAQWRKRIALAFPLIHLRMISQMGTHWNDFTKSTVMAERGRAKGKGIIQTMGRSGACCYIKPLFSFLVGVG